jgi:hypothetical protein
VRNAYTLTSVLLIPRGASMAAATRLINRGCGLSTCVINLAGAPKARDALSLRIVIGFSA